MQHDIYIAPSILSADFLHLGDELADSQRPVHLPRPIRKDRHTSLPHEFLDALLRQHA